jgi:hypothetical protein
MLFQGHLFELSAATKSLDAKEQLQEVEEVAETVDEFLTLAKVRPRVPQSGAGPLRSRRWTSASGCGADCRRRDGHASRWPGR